MTTPTEAPDAPEGINLLGSEMFTWSDLDSERGPAGGALLEELVRRHLAGERARRALVVGPHSRELITVVGSLADAVDVHVRSLPDAQTLRAELPENITLLCGAFGRLAQRGAYDLVVVLDGLDRVASAEEAPVGWADLLDRVSGQVGDGGRLLLAVGNSLGLDRLLAVDPQNLDRDESWPAGLAVDGVAVPGLHSIHRALAASATTAHVTTWAAFGRRSAPALVAAESVISDEAEDPRLATLVERAARELEPGLATTRDIGAVARTMVMSGRGLDAAPLWLLGCSGSSESGPVMDDAVLLALASDVPTAITADWARRPLGEGARPLSSAVVADPALLEGHVPSGRLLADLLADCCRDQDMAGAGVLVRRYRTWAAAGGGDGTVAPEKVAVTLDNLVDTSDGLVPFDPHLRAGVEASVDDVVTRTILAFARDFLASGAPHAWPQTYGPADLTRSLVAAAGTELDAGGLKAAEALGEKLGLAPRAPARPAYAEALEELDRLRRGQVEAEAQLEWLVRNVHDRQRLARRLRARIWRLERSPEYRLGARMLKLRAMAGSARRKVMVKLGLSEPPALAAPEGEWREAPQVEREQVPVEPDLLPPGYKPSGPTI